MNKLKKIKNIFNESYILDKKLLKDYGFKTAFIDFNKSILFRKNKGIGKKIYYYKYENFKEKLYNKYNEKMDLYFSKEDKMNNIKEDCNIYFFWWQGIDQNTPNEIIQNLNSVKRNCKNHKVIVLTENNIRDYVDIDENIYNKLKKGYITITHFSDLLRVKLLSTYGGIWSDASFYWTKPLPSYIYNLPIFSIKHGLYADFHICKGLWTDGLFASGDNCILFKYMYEIFVKYWSDYNYLCCYLLIDVLFALAYEKWNIIKDSFNAIPYNNKDVFFFYDNGTKQFNEQKYVSVISSTSIFRNHTKMKKSFETNNKQKTYYYQFYNEYLKKESL